MPNCFKCDTEIKSAVIESDEKTIWEMPAGVHFTGGWNFGSTIYDAFADGIQVELIICDPCLKEAKNTNRIREVAVKEQ